MLFDILLVIAALYFSGQTNDVVAGVLHLASAGEHAEERISGGLRELGMTGSGEVLGQEGVR